MDKKEIRKKMIRTRNLLSQSEVEIKSKNIFDKLISSDEIKKSKTIGIYVSMKNEVDTTKIIEYLLNDKTVCVPKVVGKNMHFYKIDSLNELSRSSYGILEPNNNNIVNKESIDTMVVPLVSYNDRFHRIGHGGGYYDRYLSDFKGYKIGLAYNFQKADFLEDSYDIALNYIISEKDK